MRKDAKSSGTLESPQGPLGCSMNPTAPEADCLDHKSEGMSFWFCQFHREFHEVPRGE
jgi:hypothetical protein